IVSGAALAQDLIIDDIPVVRGQSGNPQEQFESSTFIYPNPVSGSQATFNIFVPFQSNIVLKIFNVAGELAYEKNFANQPPSINNGTTGPISFVWPLTNAAGRRVAPGVYFVVIREEENLGGGNVLQTVKKILVQ
ncbi:MAG: hypothetical protein HY551_07050, partial [Elusimicrobia bacterium]|nr:hypothetical protein [Elusimicrobiota bacterium]